jgi:hypothetical protein
LTLEQGRTKAKKKKKKEKERTYCHSIAEDKEANFVGRVDRYVSMLCKASIAEPITLQVVSIIS